MSGKRAALAAENAVSTSHASLPFLVASEPLIEVKQLRSANFAKPRFAAIVTLFLLLLLTTGYVASLVIGHLNQGTTMVKCIPLRCTPAPTHIDYLTDQQNWPRSKTFFYDNQTQRYHILNNSAQGGALALYNGNQLNKFSLTVTMAQLHHSRENADYYGIIFRSDADQSHYYLFEVITKAAPEYVFSRFDNGQWHYLASGVAPSLKSGLGQDNTVTINASSNTFTFSINHKIVRNAVIDPMRSPLPAGQIGLYVEDQGAEVAFSHLYIVSHK